MLFRAAPGSGNAGPYSHDGEELVYVLSGSIEIWLDEHEHFELGAGEACALHLATRTESDDAHYGEGKRPHENRAASLPPSGVTSRHDTSRRRQEGWAHLD